MGSCGSAESPRVGSPRLVKVEKASQLVTDWSCRTKRKKLKGVAVRRCWGGVTAGCALDWPAAEEEKRERVVKGIGKRVACVLIELACSREERKYYLLDGEVRFLCRVRLAFYHMRCRLVASVSVSWPRHVSGYGKSET